MSLKMGKVNNKGLRRQTAYLVAALAFLFGAALLVRGGFGATTASAQGQQFGLDTVVATIDDTNLLDQPMTSGAVVLPLPVNSQAMVVGGPFNDGWYWLDVNGTRGYVQGSVLVAVDANYKPVPTKTPTSAATNTPVPPTATRTPAKPTNTPVTTKPTNTTTAPKATDTAVPPATSVATSPATAGPQQTATTVLTGTVVPAGTATPSTGAPSEAGVYTNLWLAEMATGGNVRVGPGMDQKVLKGWWAGRRVILFQATYDSKGNLWYRVSDPPEQPMWVHSSLIRKVAPIQYQPAKFKGKWVDVNIGQQVVVAYQDATPVKVTLASTGKSPNDTDLGVWKIYWRLPSQEMKGGSKASADYYDLPNVPWVQYFNTTGEALHGTYWHDDFGHPHSHGCVNLSTPIAQWFYNWDTVGTIVNVHK